VVAPVVPEVAPAAPVVAPAAPAAPVVAPARVAPARVAPARVAPARVAPARIPPTRVAPGVLNRPTAPSRAGIHNSPTSRFVAQTPPYMIGASPAARNEAARAAAAALVASFKKR